MSAPCHCNCVDNILKSFHNKRCPNCELWQGIFNQRMQERDLYLQQLERTRADFKKCKEEYSNIRQRMGAETCRDTGPDKPSSEDMNNPCSVSFLKRRFDLLAEHWPKVAMKVQENNKPITEHVELIKDVFNMAKSDIDTKTEELKKMFSCESEETGEATERKAVENVSEHFHALLKECYHLGCLMALHNPPLDFSTVMDHTSTATEPATMCGPTQSSCQEQDASVNKQGDEGTGIPKHTK